MQNIKKEENNNNKRKEGKNARTLSRLSRAYRCVSLLNCFESVRVDGKGERGVELD